MCQGHLLIDGLEKKTLSKMGKCTNLDKEVIKALKSMKGEKKKSIRGGRVPGSATYTKLRVGQGDSIKLSSLHGSRNNKLLQGEGIKIIIYLCCMEVGTKIVE